jgi:hypothetical protein
MDAVESAKKMDALIREKINLEMQLSSVEAKLTWLKYEKWDTDKELETLDPKKYFRRIFSGIHKDIVEYEVENEKKNFVADPSERNAVARQDPRPVGDRRTFGPAHMDERPDPSERHAAGLQDALEGQVQMKFMNPKDRIRYFYMVHNTLRRYEKDAKFERHYKDCRGHRIHTYYDGALCLDCGEGYCAALFSHCCCVGKQE